MGINKNTNTNTPPRKLYNLNLGTVLKKGTIIEFTNTDLLIKSDFENLNVGASFVNRNNNDVYNLIIDTGYYPSSIIWRYNIGD
jgi:hypothetical protein